MTSSNGYAQPPSYPPPRSAPIYPSSASYQQHGRIDMPTAQPYRGAPAYPNDDNDSARAGMTSVPIAPPIRMDGYGRASQPYVLEEDKAKSEQEENGFLTSGPYSPPTTKHHHQQKNGYADPQFSLHPTQANQALTSSRIQADLPRSYESASERELDEEEEEMLRKGVLDWQAMKSWRFWFKKEYIKWYIVLIAIVVLVGLMAIFHTQIINWLKPFTTKLRDLTGGWLIPIAIITALSFPPLFGQEIVIVLVGLIWGLGEGFGITAAGTILGEVLNFIVFKYACRARAEKIEHKSLNYACLTRVLRDGGFLMATVSRLSAIPTHVTTTIFAVSGFNFWLFCAAMVVSLPKQLIAVYVGVVLGQSSSDSKSRAISDSVFAATGVVTIGALWWIYVRMQKVRLEVWREHRAYLKAKGVPDGELPVDMDTDGRPTAVGKDGPRAV